MGFALGFEFSIRSLSVSSSSPASMHMELTIRSRGYQTADENRVEAENRSDSVDLHAIAIDSIHTPILSMKHLL